MNIKQFIQELDNLKIVYKLSTDKTFVTYTPTLPTSLVNTAVELDHEMSLYLNNIDAIQSDENLSIISNLVDQDEDTNSSFKLVDITPESLKPVPIEDMTSESFDKDFDYIRANLKTIINSGTVALTKMIEIANASNHPRAFEVVATLMKSIADVNKDLLDSHKKKYDQDDASGRKTINNTQNVQNNSIFVGSTAELSKFLKNQGKQ